VDIFLVWESQLVRHLILHLFNSWEQNRSDSNVSYGPSQPVQPDEHHKGQPKSVESIERELKDGKAELYEGIHDEGVGVASHGLHVVDEMCHGDQIDHVDGEQYDDNVTHTDDDVTGQESLPLVTPPLRPEALTDFKICSKSPEVQQP